MKAKKKPLGIKHKIREERKREERIGLAVIATILIAIISVSGFFINSMLNQPPTNPTSQTVSSTSEPKVAIVDHLSLTFPNQTFIKTATNILKQAGYTVDYYPGEKVTVEFYRNLPTYGYDIIILRVHSAIGKEGGPPVSLFTSEYYSQNRYVSEQLSDQLTRVHYNIGNEEQLYFGILPNFVRSSMNGKFQNSIIIMMGCNGLTYLDMAKTFVERGAKVYISWTDSILASHTDLATTHLLQHFLIEKLTLKKAVQETFKEVGFDPVYESLIVYYPLEAGDQTIEDNMGN